MIIFEFGCTIPEQPATVIPVVLDQLVTPQISVILCYCVSAVPAHLLPVVKPVPLPQAWHLLWTGQKLCDMFDIRLFLFALSCQLNIRHIPTESGTDACCTARSSGQSRTIRRILRIRTFRAESGTS